MKKRNKGIIIGLPILVVAVGLLLFFRSKDYKDFVDESKINNIMIKSGNTGDYMKVTEKKDINTILSYLDHISFQRKPSMPWGGFSYSITFYDNEEELANIVYDDKIADIDGDTYSVRNTNDTSMEDMIKSLKNSIFKETE